MTRDEMFELANDISENIRTGAFNTLPEHLKLSKRQDLNGLLLIDKILARNPDHKITRDIIVAAEHDIFYLSADVEQLAKVITEEEIHALIASSINFSSDEDCLYIFT